LAVLTRTLPAGDSRTEVARANHAAGLVAHKQYRDAEGEFRMVITTLEGKPKENCSTLGSAYNSLGALLQTERRNGDAVGLLEDALKTDETCRGAEHPMLIQPLNNLGVAYAALNRPTEAESMFQRALSLAEQKLGADHPFYAKVLANYAEFLRRTNRSSLAKKFAAQSAAVLRDNARRNGVGMTVDVSSLRGQ
jgi:tetratricopeptide (TPR) repeat protein